MIDERKRQVGAQRESVAHQVAVAAVQRPDQGLVRELTVLEQLSGALLRGFAGKRGIVLVFIILEPALHFLRHRALGFLIQVLARLEDVEQGCGDEAGQLAHRLARKPRAPDQRLVPRADLHGRIQEAVEGILADLRAGVFQERRDRAFVLGRDDRVGHLLAHALAARNGAQLARGVTALDNFQEVLVAEQRRELEHRASDHLLGVAGQALDDVARRRGHVLEGLGHDLAHARRLILGQGFDHLDQVLMRLGLCVGVEFGQEIPDLVGEMVAHRLVVVARQDEVGLARRLEVGGDPATHLGRIVLGQEIEDFRPQVLALGQARAHLRIVVSRQALGFLVAESVVPDRRPGLEQPHRASSDFAASESSRSPLPRRLTRYIAWSARSISSCKLSFPSGSQAAMPTDRPRGVSGPPE